jgi:hypothetical protein
MNWLNKMFCDEQGIPDDARVSAFIIVLAFVGNSIFAVIMSISHAFDAQQFGIGVGAMAAGIGVWFGARKNN